jgi:hypothetical protein
VGAPNGWVRLQFLVVLASVVTLGPSVSAEGPEETLPNMLPTIFLNDGGGCVCGWDVEVSFLDAFPVYSASGKRGVLVGATSQGFAYYYGLDQESLADVDPECVTAALENFDPLTDTVAFVEAIIECLPKVPNP